MQKKKRRGETKIGSVTFRVEAGVKEQMLQIAAELGLGEGEVWRRTAKLMLLLGVSEAAERIRANVPTDADQFDAFIRKIVNIAVDESEKRRVAFMAAEAQVGAEAPARKLENDDGGRAG